MSFHCDPAQPGVNSTRGVHALENPACHFVYALCGVYFAQPPQPPVVCDQRCSLLLVRLQPRPDYFLPVVLPQLKLSAVVIALPCHFRRAIEDIINLTAHLTHPPPSDPAHQQPRVNREVNDHRLPLPMLLQHLTQVLRLRHRARKTAKPKTMPPVRL